MIFKTPFVFISFGFSIGTIFTLWLVWYFVRHPEKFEKWSSMIYWFLSYIWKRLEYRAIKSEIQGKINTFVRSLESSSTMLFPRIVIKWSGIDGENIIWEDGEAIIVMRDREHRNKNFVHAAQFFVSEALLRKAKRHLSITQKSSLDLYATKKILENENIAALEQFVDGYLAPSIEKNDEIRELVKQYTQIDRKGLFFPVLIQEISILGNKVFLEKPRDEIVGEVKSLISFLERFSNRELGDKITPADFMGRYTRCAIKIVASQESRLMGNIDGYKRSILDAFHRGYENVYVLGRPDSGNMEFVNRVCDVAIQGNNSIECIKKYQFVGLVTLPGKKSFRANTYLVHLHNPSAVKYLYQQNDIDG